MSSNMATGAKPIKVLTSYKQNELKLVKVSITRHNIKVTANKVQPFVRKVDNPFSITSMVHLSGTEYGKLFRKIIPNTIQLPLDAYSVSSKAATGKNTESQEAEPPRQRSASCSSDEDTRDDRRSRSTDKFIASEAEPTMKQKRRTPERERSRSRAEGSPGRSTHEDYESRDRHEKRKSARPRSGSPPSRSMRSKSSPSRHHGLRNISTTRGLFVPDKVRSRDREREREHTRDMESKSPSPSSQRQESSRGRKRSRDKSSDRYRHSSRSPTSDRRSRNHSRSRSSERRPEDRRSDFVNTSDYYSRGGYFEPNLIRPPPLPVYPPIAPFYPAPGLPYPFFNRPFFPPEPGFGEYRPRRKLPVYNNRQIPRFALAVTPSTTSTIISNGGESSQAHNSDPQTTAANGTA